MGKYIDKDALVTEIEKLKEIYNKCITHNNYEDGLKEGRLIGYEDVLHKINTIEVKEVDLEEEIDKWYINEASKEFENVLYEDIEKYAKHFFELGLKAQKGE